jgi:HAD superfamily hydrolase (TIGR01509 family)
MTGSGLVIFDCDGVLVDSERISLPLLHTKILELGVAMSEAEVWQAFHGVTLEVVESGVAERFGGAPPAGWLDGFLAERARRFEVELQAVPGAHEAVAGVLELGWEICVASNGSPAKMCQTLALTGLREWFSDKRVFSVAAVGRGKPAPDLFLHAAGACGQPPERCVVVEDTTTGVRAARAAGMRVLGYAPDGTAAALAALGAEPLRDLRELPARLAAG